MKSILLSAILLLPLHAEGQVTKADYERATNRRTQLQGLAVNVPDAAHAIANTSRFWYRKSVKGGSEFVVVDAEGLSKRAAFDQERLAAALSTASGEKYKALTLPFSTLDFVDKETAIEFSAAGASWKCDLTAYACKKQANGNRGPQAARPPEDSEDDSPREFENDVYDGMIDLSPQAIQARQGLQFPNQT